MVCRLIPGGCGPLNGGLAAEQEAEEHVLIAPGVPVIDVRGVDKPHPPVIVVGKVGGDEMLAHFLADAAADARVKGIELRAQQIIGPGEQRARLGAAQIDHMVLPGRDPGPGIPEIKGGDPDGLLADAENAGDNLLKKTPLPFQTLGQDEDTQSTAPLPEAVKIGNIFACLLEMKIVFHGKGRPVVIKVTFGCPDPLFFCFRNHVRPFFPLGAGGGGVEGNLPQGFLQRLAAAFVGQHGKISFQMRTVSPGPTEKVCPSASRKTRVAVGLQTMEQSAVNRRALAASR